MQVHICENNIQGTKSGKACAIIFFDARGDLMLNLESVNLLGDPLRTSDSHVIYHGEYFNHNGTQEWAGNMLWNGYDIPDEHAMGFINALHRSRQWSVNEAWVEIARAWQECGELTGDLFEIHGIQPARVNPNQLQLIFNNERATRAF